MRSKVTSYQFFRRTTRDRKGRGPIRDYIIPALDYEVGISRLKEI